MASSFLSIDNRAQVINQIAEKVRLLYVKLRHRHRKPWPYTIDSLMNFPDDTLGKTLGEFLYHNGFELVGNYERHDIFHIMTGYQPTVKDEVSMQFFLLGNGKFSPSTITTCFVGLLMLPEFIPTFIKDIRRGSKCRSIHKWDFEHLLYEPLAQLKGLMHRRDISSNANLFF